ncbi:DUF4188 domain-containing protein [Janibacter melonis]|uniref:DUF4188 domain-containing protein n=1 Tax=Janibacter melonis TaxID=262209 RepID=UPI001CD88B3D|nr:DUF4188 domain-containing protein [Janibacter melonis]
MADRRTHAHDGDVVVFLIGMRPTKWWRVDKLAPVLAAMPRMLAELERNKARAAQGLEPHLGYLGSRTAIGPGGPVVIQYWRSTDELYAYASNPDAAHVPAWRAFNRAVRSAPGAVGIWHETYAVPAAGIETMYVDAEIGLGAATGTVPAGRPGCRGARRGRCRWRRRDQSRRRRTWSRYRPRAPRRSRARCRPRRVRCGRPG